MARGANPHERYELLEAVGQGSFGKVYKGRVKQTGESVAVKLINLEEAEDEIDDIQKEIAMISACNSDYVTRYHASCVYGTTLWIVMEFVDGGSVLDVMQTTSLRESEMAVILREVLRGLHYLHSEGKIHRDIKAANILLCASGAVKLADFGVAGQLTQTMSKRNTFVGTPFWMAPEVIAQSNYDWRADIWSLGITAIELCRGEPPLAHLHPMKVLLQIPKSPPPELEADGPWSREMREFVSLCLCKSARARPAAGELLNHPFIRGAGETAALGALVAEHKAATGARGGAGSAAPQYRRVSGGPAAQGGRGAGESSAGSQPSSRRSAEQQQNGEGRRGGAAHGAHASRVDENDGGSCWDFGTADGRRGGGGVAANRTAPPSGAGTPTRAAANGGGVDASSSTPGTPSAVSASGGGGGARCVAAPRDGGTARMHGHPLAIEPGGGGAAACAPAPPHHAAAAAASRGSLAATQPLEPLHLAHAVENGAARMAAAGGDSSSAAPFNCVPVVVAPVLAKLLGTHREREVQKGIAQLKLAFDNLEKVRPGLSAEVLGAVYGLCVASPNERARAIAAVPAAAAARAGPAAARPPPAAAAPLLPRGEGN